MHPRLWFVCIMVCTAYEWSFPAEPTASRLEPGCIMLDDFEQESITQAESATLTLSTNHVTSGTRAGRLEFKTGNIYPGLTLAGDKLKVKDFTPFWAIMFDFYNPCQADIPFCLVLTDQNKKVSRRWLYLPACATNRTGMIISGMEQPESGGAFDWRQVISIHFYTQPPIPDLMTEESPTNTAPLLYVDSIRLIPRPEREPADNMLPNGNFDAGYPGGTPAGWVVRRPGKAVIAGCSGAMAQLVEDQPSFDADRTVMLKGGMTGPEISLDPGNWYQFSCWIKTDLDNTLVSVSFDGWVPNAPHWYAPVTFMARKRWREFKYIFKVPGKGEAKYVEHRKFMRPSVGTENANTTAWISGLKLRKIGIQP